MEKISTFKDFIKEMLITLLVLIVLLSGLWFYMLQMPNVSFRGKAPPVDREFLNNLKSHIVFLANDPRGRNYYSNNSLAPSKKYIIDQFRSYGYQVSLQEYQPFVEMHSHIDTELLAKYHNLDETYANIEVELRGKEKPDEIIIVGAHYDTVAGSPGANDNASGVAGILEIARRLQGQNLSRTVRFVAFVNEEMPFFKIGAMGSLVYAKRSAARKEKIVGMIAFETIGYFVDAPGTQKYPSPLNYFYPDKGNFIGFISNLSSRKLLRELLNIFRQNATVPSEGAVLPAFVPGVGWSDHWSFWENNYPAIMITDTAFYRYPYYHKAQDTPNKINYEQMTRVIKGMQKVVEVFAKK